MAEADRSKPTPFIVWVLIVVGLNLVIHHRLSPPGQALGQMMADVGALWSRTVAAAPHDTAAARVSSDRPSDRPS